MWPDRGIYWFETVDMLLRMHGTLQVDCPAKVNLALAVAPPGLDNMHQISSWFITIDMKDTLELTALPDDGISCYGIVWADDAPRKTEIEWPIQDDLAVRAHMALERQVRRRLPVKMKLTKRIPVGGGLGGGSSNAAAMLRGLNRLFQLEIPNEQLEEVGSGLGSDVPFLVSGGSAHVRGLGEKLSPGRVPGLHMVLVFPEASCRTGSVYGHFDTMLREDHVIDDERVSGLIDSAVVSPDAPFNDLQDAAMDLYPELADVASRVEALAERSVHLSGSGSTLYVICDDPLHAEALAAAISEQLEIPAIATGSQQEEGS